MDAKEIRKNFADLAKEVRDSEGCLSVLMSHLRTLVGAGRLDGGPKQQIEWNLNEVGLRATELTTSGVDWVMVYEPTSPIGRVITAAQGQQEDDHEHLLAAIRACAPQAGLSAPEREELEELRQIVGQIRALTSAA